MKVTKLKSAKRQTLKRKTVIADILPSQLKSKLQKSRGAGLVLFEENDQCSWEELLSGDKEIAIAAKDIGKTFNIRLAESSLDVYRSPHLIDLSHFRRLEDTLRFRTAKEYGYADMPGGDFLVKYHILDFWDWQKSEIFQSLRAFVLRLKEIHAGIFNRPEFSPLLMDERQEKAKQSYLEEVSFVSLILFFADFYGKIFLFIRQIVLIAKLLLKASFGQDETVWLDKDRQQALLPTNSLIDRLIAISQEPMISDLLKPSAIGDNGNSDKFKLINHSAGSKKEIQEKYLAGNFVRKGVVVTPQKPSRPWPKDSFSWDLGHFAYSSMVLKPAMAFLIVLVVLAVSVKATSYWQEIYSVKGRVMGEAEQALNSLNSATGDLKSLDFNAARQKFSAANSNFVSAQNQIDEIKSFLTTLAEVAPAENTFKSGTNIIDMGEHLSKAAGSLLDGVSSASGGSDLSLASRIKNFSLAVLPALDELKAAKINSDNIGVSSIPAGQRDKFIKLKSALPDAIAGLQSLADSATFAVKALGDNDVRRYLLVFQNNNELRATGGFMGSFALVDLRGGKIDKITIPEGGTYDVRAGFNQLIVPPDPLRLVSDRWEFQDANWWPDFPTSAQNIKWFYEKSGGPTVDGVIAVNSSFLGRLLSLTGPIDLPDYGKTISADNCDLELQKSIELEATEKTKPKKILGELAPILLDKLLNSDSKQIFNLAETLNDGLRQRNIQMYFTDSQLEKFAQAGNWAGELNSTPGSDFLSVNSTNIGGGKTDSVIKQKIYHSAEIQPDGTVVDKVLIERRNIGPTDEFFTYLANNSYLRIYVPQGSELIHAEGFKGFSADKFQTPATGTQPKAELSAENSAQVDPLSGTKVYNENGQTVFANWSIAGPGEMRELLLVYKLPFKVAFDASPKSVVEKAADMFSAETATYSFKFQKQSGRDSDSIESDVSYSADMNLSLTYPEAVVSGANKVTLAGQTDTDKFLIAGFSKK